MAAVWIPIIISAANAAYGASQSNKAQKENKRAASDAAASEEERRANIQSAIEDFFNQYNELRNERPGMTIEEYISDRLKVLNNPELKAAFRSLTQEDFNQAQDLADQATAGNLESFHQAAEALSGGFYDVALAERNKIAQDTNSEAAYARAMQLYSPYVPAGSVGANNDPSSNLSRANKGAFQVAYEVDQEQQQLKYGRLNDILNSDRNLALSQQEKAKTFMPFTSFVNYATDLHTNQRRDQLAMQLADESFYQSILGGLLQQGYTDQTRTPGYRDTSVYDKMVADGVSSTVKGAASIYTDKKSSS